MAAYHWEFLLRLFNEPMDFCLVRAFGFSTHKLIWSKVFRVVSTWPH